MRQRSVNTKAVEKLSRFLFEVRDRLANKLPVNFTDLYERYNISKSSLSALKKLGYVIEKNDALEWVNNLNHADRTIALKILELLRQRTDRQTDKPISELWVSEIAALKLLLTEIRDNTIKKDNAVEGFKISDRVYLAGQIASIAYGNAIIANLDAYCYPDINTNILKATDDLLNKLNK